LTAGITRNGTSKFGPPRPATTTLLGAPVGQAEDVREVVGHGDCDAYDYTPYDDASAYGGAFFYGDEEWTAESVQAVNVAEARSEDGEPELGRDAGRYIGRHAGGRDKASRGKATGSKTARKRVGRVVVPVAAAAVIAAGTAAAYGLSSGGRPQAGHLNAAMTLPSAAASARVAGAGNANEIASAPIAIASATASDTARVPVKHVAKATPTRKPSAVPSATAQSESTKTAAAKASAPAAMTRTAAPAATHAATPVAATKAAAATTLSCTAGSGLLPDNVTAIVGFLLANGYSHNAAAGIAGNIYQESKGNPESVGSGGGGLIGWTPLPAGFITGNVTADLKTQLAQILTYNQVWSQFLPALNSAASPADAASIYVTDFERAGIPAASTREASAEAVASACGL
jgi:hypothetical protein